MHRTIGFIVLSHDKPAQLARLLQRIHKLFDGPPIVCHHDFSKSSLQGYDFPKQIAFVRPHLVTRWGDMSLVSAFFTALQTMYERPDSPDWFVLISGSDYPVRSPQAVIDELTSRSFDAYLDHREVSYPWTPDPNVEYAKHSFKSERWVPVAYDRYVAIHPWAPWYSRSHKKLVKFTIAHIRSHRLVGPLTPFSKTLRCFGGSQWFTGSRKAADRLLRRDGVNRSLIKHYSTRFIPDESLPHTILCNQPDLSISSDELRYIDWSQGGHHPKILGVDDIPKILASGAHFARKFDLANGVEVLDAIDAVVDDQNS